MNWKYGMISTIGLIVATTIMYRVSAQEDAKYTSLPPLPDSLGRAGMFAGVAGERLLIAGGANFLNEMPWEGGKKKWHDDIFILQNEADHWEKSPIKLPAGLGYGVTGSYNGQVFIVGGSTATAHHDQVIILQWENNALTMSDGPKLPHTLANMAGTTVGSLLLVVGGMITPDGSPQAICYGLDMDDLETGWFELPSWDGPARIFPVTGSYGGSLYLFSGETNWTTAHGANRRHILHDAYRFTPNKKEGKWDGQWKKLGAIPRGMSAGANPAPLLGGDKFFFSGGVDRVTALHTDPRNHPGIDGTVLWYDPENDLWSSGSDKKISPARVTLPSVAWNGNVYYISGEIKPGVRTADHLLLNDKME